MKKKCKRDGCYEPADCRHGYCAQHCHQNHRMLSNTSNRKTPRTSEPHLGLEVEVEFSNGRDLKRGLPLQACHDGSLGSYGAEYKLCAPTTKIAVKASRLVEELWTRGATVSSKCGLHVHIDARAITGDKKEALFAWAHATQDVWFGLMPPSRRGNNFARLLSGPSIHRDHYTWLHATHYSTLEVRLHGGTLNPFKITGWLAVLAHLQSKLLDPAYVFPTEGTPEERFWAVFADAPREAAEYLRSRRDGSGVVRDFAFQSREEVTNVQA